jgi:hypothetical protein
MGTIHDLMYAAYWIQAHQAQFIKIFTDFMLLLGSIYGLLAAFVKACPTLPVDHFLLPIIKFLGKLTNNQTKDEEVRATMAASNTEGKK